MSFTIPPQIIAILFIISIILIPFIIIFIPRSLIRRNHLKSLQKRSQLREQVKMVSTESPPAHWIVKKNLGLCTVSVVFGVDRIATFFAGLKHLIGGRLRWVEEILERAREEAITRLAEESLRMGANALINVRLETSNIGGANNPQQKNNFVEIIAYGTALQIEQRQN